MIPTRGDNFKFHLMILKYMGLGMINKRIVDKRMRYLYNLYQILSIIILTFLAFSDIVKVVETWHSERQLSNKFFFALNTQSIHMCSFVKILIFVKNKKTIEKVLVKLENKTIRFKRYPDIEAKTIFFTKAVTYSFFVVADMTMAFMFTYAIVKDWDRRRIIGKSSSPVDIPRELPFPLYIPWDYSGEWSYIGSFIFSIVEIYWISTPLMVVDTLIASIMMKISGQFRMVGRTLENVGKDTLEELIEKLNTRKGNAVSLGFTDSDVESDYTAGKMKLMSFVTPREFNGCIFSHLKKAIQHHQLIVGIVGDLQEAYAYGFFIQIFSSVYTIGLVMIELSRNAGDLLSFRLLNSLGFLGSALTQLFIQTYSANAVTSEAGKVFDSGYEIPWYDAEDQGSVKKLMLVLLKMTEQPVFVRAANYIPMTNELFQSILNTSYQIFTLIMGRISS